MINFDNDLDRVLGEYKVAKEKSASGDYAEIPDGKYDVSVDRCFLTETKETHKPMVSMAYKIKAGDCQGRFIFHNQVVATGMQLHILINHLRKLKFDVSDFESYTKLSDEFDALNLKKFGYVIEMTTNSKGFKNYKVEDVYEEDGFEDIQSNNDADIILDGIPF